MKAVVINFHLVLFSVLGAFFAVRSRARELPGGAGADVEVKLGDPSLPRRDAEVSRKLVTRKRRRRREKGAARKRGRDKCQRAKAITLEDVKLGEWCAKQCLACNDITSLGANSKCAAEFCRKGNPHKRLQKKSPILRGCARENLSRKMRKWCDRTCHWCAKPRECKGALTPAECTAMQNRDKTRCENLQCGNRLAGRLKRRRAPLAREADRPGELGFDFEAGFELDDEFISELDDEFISLLGLAEPGGGSG